MVAHSMGNHFVMRTLDTNPDALKWIKNIIFAAPDVPVDELCTKLKENSSNQTGPQYTLYYSSNDNALKLSSMCNEKPRAGREGIMTNTKNLRLETLDASITRAWWSLSMGHGYFLKKTSLIKDMMKIVNHTPEELKSDRLARNGDFELNKWDATDGEDKEWHEVGAEYWKLLKA